MPIKKNADGKFSAILTDTSLDRDKELMSESVMDQLSKKLNIPALADHENKMDSWVGTFQNLQKVENGGHYAVMGEPTFFSEEANPKAQQIKKQIEEASSMGGSCGISIGAKPNSSEMVTKDGEQYKQWTDIEVMEATFTPIQSNRNSYTSVAKSFGLDKSEEIKMKKTEGAEEPQETPEEEAKVEEPKAEAEKPAEPAAEKKFKPKDEEEDDADKDKKKKKKDMKEDKSAEIDVQKIVNLEVEKAMAKMPKLKAIQETVTESTAQSTSMGFIESYFAKKCNYKEEQ